MTEKDLYSKEWCDLLFEHRNKEYGAYKMRRDTGRRNLIAICSTFGIICLFVLPYIIFAIINRPYKVNLSDEIEKIARFEGVVLKEARPVRRPPKQQQESTSSETIAQKAIDEDVDRVAAVYRPQDGEIDPSKIEDISADSTELLKKEEHLNLVKDEQQTKGQVMDTIAKYPSGLRAFMQWLNSTIVFPRVCIDRKQGGKVLVAFIVEPTGKVTDIRILEGDNSYLNREVIRALKKMPDWIPAHKKGKPIRSQITIPVEFVFDDTPYS